MSIAQIPLESCMFAKLPRPAGSGRERHQELVYSFEAVLPLPVVQCQMAFVDIGEHVICCACRKSDLEPLRAAHERAIPSVLPDWLDSEDQAGVRDRLNLLTGDMQPLIQIRRRKLTLQLATAALLIIAAVVFLVTQRQSAQWSEQSQAVRDDMRALYQSVLTTANGNAQPHAIRFATLMNQLGSTRTGANQSAENRLIDDFAGLVAGWPEDLEAQVRSVSVDQSTIRLEMSVLDNEHALSMLAYLSQLNGWVVRSREMTPAADRVELRVQLARQSSEVSDA